LDVQCSQDLRKQELSSAAQNDDIVHSGNFRNRRPDDLAVDARILLDAVHFLEPDRKLLGNYRLHLLPVDELKAQRIGCRRCDLTASAAGQSGNRDDCHVL
jgi:hypothetical protein